MPRFNLALLAALLLAGPALAQPSPPPGVRFNNAVTSGHCVSAVNSTTIHDTGTTCAAAGGGITALTGDVAATGPGSAAATLATVNANVGTFQGITLDAKGRATAAAAQNYINALTGDVTAAGPNSAAATLATVNANVGTFQGITVNGKGLVTAAANQSYLTANQTITLSGDVTGSGATAITTTLATVSIAKGGTGQTSAVAARVALNQGTAAPSAGSATITPNCGASNVHLITLVTGTGPYTLANCSAAPVAGATHVFVVIQPASGSAQTMPTYGNMYKFPSPLSNASPPTLTASLNAVDIISCVAQSATVLLCAFTANYS